MLQLLDKLLDVLPGSAVVYMTALATGLSAAASGLPAGAGEWALRVAGWLGAAAVIYRRVSPVPAERRGLR